jgi:hypothetical protein
MTDVAIVFDVSALLAYVDGNLAPGELIVEVANEARRVGIPATCLVQARTLCRDAVAEGQLMLLASLPTVSVLPLGMSDEGGTDLLWEVGTTARAVGGDIAVAHAIQEALRHRAHYATTRPGQVSAVLPKGWSVLDLTV